MAISIVYIYMYGMHINEKKENEFINANVSNNGVNKIYEKKIFLFIYLHIFVIFDIYMYVNLPACQPLCTCICEIYKKLQ